MRAHTSYAQGSGQGIPNSCALNATKADRSTPFTSEASSKEKALRKASKTLRNLTKLLMFAFMTLRKCLSSKNQLLMLTTWKQHQPM